MTKEVNYETPSVEVIEVEVEFGFAQSFGSSSTEGMGQTDGIW